MEKSITIPEQFQPFDYQTHPEARRIKEKFVPEFPGITGRAATEKLLELVNVETPKM